MLVYGKNERFISNGRVGNVLIGLLEDDLAIQEMLRLLLQSEGHAVAIYASAEECLADLRVDGPQTGCAVPNLVIIDLHLAKSISGMEVIERIRANPRLSNLPLVLMTAATHVDKQELERLHATLLTKPFDVDEVLQLVEDLPGRIP